MSAGRTEPWVFPYPSTKWLQVYTMLPMDDPNLDLEALEGLTNPAEVEAVSGTLEKLTKEAELLLFIGPGCPACPHQVRSVATLALANPLVSVEIVDATQDIELATQYEISSVPTTIVNDELIMVGVIPAGELAWRLVEREGPEAENAVFAALVASGRHSDAAERLEISRSRVGPATECDPERPGASAGGDRQGFFREQGRIEVADPVEPAAVDGVVGQGLPVVEALQAE